MKTKNEVKHTLGPWEMKSSLNIGAVGSEQNLASVLPNDANFQANARLIAAAPELLSLAKVLTEEFEASPNKDQVYVPYILIEELRKVIAKVEGKSNG